MYGLEHLCNLYEPNFRVTNGLIGEIPPRSKKSYKHMLIKRASRKSRNVKKRLTK